MKKLTTIIITAIILCSVLAFACNAYSDADIASEGEITDNEHAVTDGKSNETQKTDESETTDDTAITSEQDAKNPFEAVFETVKENSDTIFSALTLLGSVILAFTYKKGLLPSLGASLGKIGDSVKKIGDATEISIIKSEGAIVDIDDKIRGIGELFDRVEEQLGELNNKMEAVDKEKEQSEITRILMRSQVDMLYDIFMTSSLPQYSKDAVGEKIAAMKLLIEKGDE